MTNIINLNKKRKAKKREEKEKQAEKNRIKYGRTKQEKQQAKQSTDKAERKLEGHKLSKCDENPSDSIEHSDDEKED